MDFPNTKFVIVQHSYPNLILLVSWAPHLIGDRPLFNPVVNLSSNKLHLEDLKISKNDGTIKI